MRRIPLILYAEHPPANQPNAQRAEVRLAGDTIKGVSGLGAILSHSAKTLEINRRLCAIEYEEVSFGQIVAGRDGYGAGQTNSLGAGNCAQPSEQVFQELGLARDG